MKRAAFLLTILAVLAAGLTAANSIGVGREGSGFGKLGAIGKKGAAPASCGSPTAPNGVIDLSVCSNASYLATILI